MPRLTPLARVSALGALAVWIAAGTPFAAQQSSDQVTVSFSDPTRPGTLIVRLMQGSLTVRGVERVDVLIDAQTDDDRGRRRNEAPDGLRRLTAAAGFVVEESDNEMRLRSSLMNGGANFTIEVPRRTHLKLSGMNGLIRVERVEGDLEINNLNAPVELTDVAGSVVAHSLNGGVQAVLTRVDPDKAMSFTSMNGAVDVTLPPTVRANLKLRTEHGDVFTDFDLQLASSEPATVEDNRGSGGRFRLELNRSLLATLNGGGPEFELRTFNGSVYLRRGQ